MSWVPGFSPAPTNRRRDVNSTTWTTRPATPDDADRVAFHALPDAVSAGEDLANFAAWIRPRIASRQYVGWLAIADDATGAVIAGAGAMLLDWGPTRANPGGCMARVNHVFTQPAWRRRGIARRLLQSVLADCEALGVREFCLGARPDARGLYESLGFVAYPQEMRRRVPPVSPGS